MLQQIMVTSEASAFYAKRDHRTNLVLAQPIQPVLVAAGIAPEFVGTLEGQLALHWFTSLVTRMGQRYNRLQIWLPPSVASTTCLLRGWEGHTLADALLTHLAAADPFGTYTVVEQPLPGSYVVTVGDVKTDVEKGAYFGTAIYPLGWGSAIDVRDESGLGPLLRSGEKKSNSFKVNPVGAALAAALGAADIYRHFNQDSLNYGPQAPLWVSALQPSTGGALDPGADAVRWSRQVLPSKIDLGKVLLVGAGALGGNALAILGYVAGVEGQVDIVEPDVADISNLNRLIEETAADEGTPKADIAVRSLSSTGLRATPHPERYEELQRNARRRLPVEEFDLVVTSVDQMATRALVQSGWPRLLIDGGTRSYSWRVSRFPVDTEGACLGCRAGKGQSRYADLLGPLACGARLQGARTPTLMQQPMDSYSFSSFMAAAFLAAEVLLASLLPSRSVSTTQVTGAVALNMAALTLGTEGRSDLCLCRCSHPVVSAYRRDKYGAAERLDLAV